MSTPVQALTWIVALGVWLPSAAAGQAVPETSLIERALRDGPRARVIRADVDVTRREQDARLTWQNPTVQYNREGAGFTEFFQVEQAFPPFGMRAALTRLGVTVTAAAVAERDARLWALRADTRTAIAQLWAAQAREDLAAGQVRELGRLIDVLRIREREGEGSRFDRVRAEQEWRDARAAATSAAVARADAAAVLGTLLPEDVLVDKVLLSPPGATQLPAVDALIDRATRARPDLKALDLAGQVTDLEADAARRARGPAPTVLGGLKRSDAEEGREKGAVVGLTLTLPLFDRGDREATRWAAERARISAQRDALTHAIAREIRRGADAVARRREAFEADDPAAAASLRDMADVAYREGDVGILDLLDAARTSARALARHVDLELDLRLAAIAVERAVGDVLWP